VLDLLGNLRGLDPLKELFWSRLNYDRVNQPLSRRNWTETARMALADDPLLFASGGVDNDFHIIYARLNSDLLWRGTERPVVSRLLQDHPYALIVFSNAAQDRWHFLNVKYDEQVERRRLFRRITVGPEERLRTASERIALLDLGERTLGPLEIQSLHDEAFDVEKVTSKFFEAYHGIFNRAEAKIEGLDGNTRRLFTQQLFNRLLFIIFLERKGWLTLNGRRDYLQALWDAHQKEKAKGEAANFYDERLKLLFFAALNTPNEVNIVGIRRDGFLQSRIGQAPYLNGGLFEEDDLDRDPAVHVPDDALASAVRDLLYHFNFTVTESTPLDVEVAVDPEMLGKIFEELVTGRHETGRYYTPKPVVSFMCREALKGYLQTACPREAPDGVGAFVDDHDPTRLKNAESMLSALRTVRACDPACGSGAYLVGLLHELLNLRAALFVTRGLDSVTMYQRKLDIIQTNLYGVDLDPFAVDIARLRLWLSLSVDFEDDDPPPLPNLDFKIEVGDSLTAPDPSGGLQPDLFRQKQIEEYFALKADYLMSHGGEKLTLRGRIEQLHGEIAAWTHPPLSRTGEGRGGFDWAVEFAEVFSPPPLSQTGEGRGGGAGFDIVLANPPYVRADAPYRHIADEDERQAAIAHWQKYRQDLKAGKIYQTLYEKWDLYIPFLERAYQLLRPNGQMVFIIPDAHNAAKYAKKSHEFFLQRACVERIDFCTDIPLFEAGVSNTILHFARTGPDAQHTPVRVRRWGERPDDFETNAEPLPTSPQAELGVVLFKAEGLQVTQVSAGTVELWKICYISKGMVIHSEERKYKGLFTKDDVISEGRDRRHPKLFIEGKDIVRWYVRRVRYLEYGTKRAPAMFSRPTFPQLYKVPEKLISLDVAGDTQRVVYDNRQLFHNHTADSFVPWHYLKGARNKSIQKTAKYRDEVEPGKAPAVLRDELEKLSQQFAPKYLLAVMNSKFAREWLSTRKQHKIHFYPNDWKQLPIAPLPKEQQQEFVRLVDAILAEYERHGYPLPPKSAARVAELEREIDERVAGAYGL